jgi:hypothetical protein
MMNERQKSKLMDYLLGTLELFIGVSALAGGFGLISDPSGIKMNLQTEWLTGSPFSNYLIPGIVLLTVIGFGNFFASIAAFFHRGSAKFPAVYLGFFLILFLIVEIWTVGYKNPLQPIFFILGAVQLAFGLKVQKIIKTESGGSAEQAVYHS